MDEVDRGREAAEVMGMGRPTRGGGGGGVSNGVTSLFPMRVGSDGGGGEDGGRGEAGGDGADVVAGSKKAFRGLDARAGGGIGRLLWSVDSNWRKRSVTETFDTGTAGLKRLMSLSQGRDWRLAPALKFSLSPRKRRGSTMGVVID